MRRRSRAPTRSDLTIRDALLLIGSMAIGFAAIRESGRLNEFWETTQQRTSHGLVFEKAVTLMFAAKQALVPISVGWLLAGFRRPGTSSRRFWRRPGSVACLTAVIVQGLDDIVSLITNWENFPKHSWIQGFFWLTIGVPNPETIGRSILFAWLILAVSGQSRPGRGLFDRLGIAIGLLWIFFGLFHAYLF